MKNVTVKVRETCNGLSWNYGMFKGKEMLMRNIPTRSTHGTAGVWWAKSAAIRNAKSMAKRIGIPYDPEIIKQHGC